MKLSEVLDETAVVLPLEEQDKWAVIELLVDRLVASGRANLMIG